MAELFLFYRRREQENALRNSWRFRDVQNPFQLDERKFLKRFRLSKFAAQHLINELRPYVQICSRGYSLEIQVLVFLRVMGSGSFQNVIGDSIFAQVSQPSVSRFLTRITDAILHIAENYIDFPTDRNGIRDVVLGFYQKFGFPNVCGVVDGTHIHITKPDCTDSKVFLNRKARYTLNVQMVCDSDLNILDVVARWPGSTHDSYIWNFCGLKHILHNYTQNVFLLGDSGYALQTVLLTPYLNPITPPEILFNKKFKRTRNVIERCFGVLKSRFRFLDESGGRLMYSPGKVCHFVVAAAVLHNFCVRFKVPLPESDANDNNINDDDNDEDDNNDDDEEEEEFNQARGQNWQQASQLRDDLARRFQASR